MSQMIDRNYDFEKLVSRFPGVHQGDTVAGTRRYHLFHAPNSVCSQKVRATLLALNEPFVSHLVDIFSGENFDETYVRARVHGCKEAGLPLSSLHFGGTSVRVTGCDACVVPTLVHDETHKVTVDSLRICLSINAERRADMPSLIPAEVKQAVEEELAIIDMLPNYPLLADAMAKDQNVKVAENSYSAKKAARSEALMRAHADEPDLFAAYQAKRDKDLSANSRIFTPEAVSRAYQEIKNAFEGLDQRLRKSNGDYLFDHQTTLADLFWGVQLIRAEDLGLNSIWAAGQLPALEEYYGHLTNLPALKQAIIHWPRARLSFKNIAKH